MSASDIRIEEREWLPVLKGGTSRCGSCGRRTPPRFLATADDRGSRAVHLAAADHGRRLRAVHRVDAIGSGRRQVRLLRRDAEGLRHGNRHLPDSPDRKPDSDRRMGLRHRLGVLGHGRVQGERESDLHSPFDTLGVHRLEARAAVRNGRGNGRFRRWAPFRKVCCASRSYERRVSRPGALRDPRDDWRASRRRSRVARRALTTVDRPAARCSAVRPISLRRSTGRDGSDDHSLHDPAYNFAPCRPACSIASRLWHAVTPDPQ